MSVSNHGIVISVKPAKWARAVIQKKLTFFVDSGFRVKPGMTIKEKHH
jgi:hypothetical protein